MDFSDGGDGSYSHQTTTSDFMLPVVGETYTVKWDGTEYECACSDFETYPVLGNLSMLDLTGGEEYPFIIMDQNGVILIGTAEQGASHTISILRTETTYSLIDSNYLPEYKHVSYETQNLTDTEKEIARNNINAIDKSVLIQIPNNIVLASDFDAYYEKYRKTGLPIIWNGQVVNYIRLTGSTNGFKEYVIVTHDNYLYTLREYEYNGEKYVNIDNRRPLYDDVYTNRLRFKDQARELYKDFTLTLDGSLTNGDGVLMLWNQEVIVSSCTEGSTKQFKITVDDSGKITATEVS